MLVCHVAIFHILVVVSSSVKVEVVVNYYMML